MASEKLYRNTLSGFELYSRWVPLVCVLTNGFASEAVWFQVMAKLANAFKTPFSVVTTLTTYSRYFALINICGDKHFCTLNVGKAEG